MDLFDHASDRDAEGTPLSDRMRPRSLGEVVGQRHLVASDRLLAKAIRGDRIPSMILWGPPGTGKTTLAGQRQLHLQPVLREDRHLQQTRCVGPQNPRW